MVGKGGEEKGGGKQPPQLRGSDRKEKRAAAGYIAARILIAAHAVRWNVAIELLALTLLVRTSRKGEGGREKKERGKKIVKVAISKAR